MAAGLRFSSGKPLVSHVSGTTQHKTWLGAKGPRPLHLRGEVKGHGDPGCSWSCWSRGPPHYSTSNTCPEPPNRGGEVRASLGRGGGAVARHTQACLDGRWGPESGSSPGGGLRLHSLSVRHKTKGLWEAGLVLLLPAVSLLVPDHWRQSQRAGLQGGMQLRVIRTLWRERLPRRWQCSI